MAQSRKHLIKHAEITQTFAKRLRAIRTSKDVTQRDLAERAHVTLSYISKLEAGGAAPGIDLVDRLATALNVNVTELLPFASQQKTDHEQIKILFDQVIMKAGQESLLLLNLFLSRLAESPALRR